MNPKTKLSTLDAVQLFPAEAKVIASSKIKEYEGVRDCYTNCIQSVLTKIAKIDDEFSRFFWEEAFKICLSAEYRHALERLSYWKRLRLLLRSGKARDREFNFERSKLIAKEIPIQDLYPFEKLRKIGKRYQAICPFHTEKTPSFVIYPNNSFFCFGCQKSGDSISFIKLTHDCSFKEAIGQLAGGYDE